jgi:LPXTG-motif cell wall-anchored protein
VEALLTQAALAQTQAAQQLLTQTATPTATGLPDTGFADDIGAPTLLGMAALLILVIFIARRMRAATG